MLATWAVFALLLSGRPAAAQGAPTTDIETQIKEAERKKKAFEEAQRQAEEAKKRQVPGGERAVSYEQVLAAPDDIDLNFRFARSEVQKGNLRAAASTLERILMVDPKLPKVRLFYAIVLFRLDSLNDAEKELKILQTQAMADSLRAEVNQYVREIRRRRTKDRFSVTAGAGLDFDDNRNSAPGSGQRLLADTVINLNSASTRKNDVAKTMLAGLGWTHSLPFQGGHKLFADVSYYRAEQTQVRSLNIQNYSADLGLALKSARFVDLTPSFEFNHLRLTEATYMRSQAAKVSLYKKLAPRWEAFGHAGYTSQINNRTRVVTNGNQFSGEKVEGGVGVGCALTPSQKLSLSYSRVNQGVAISKFYAYARDSLTLSHSFLLGKGQFLLSSVTYNYDAYEQADPAVSTKVRSDDTVRLHFTYGFPLGFLHRSLPNAVWTFGYDYYHAVSNITNYAYTNNKVSTFLTYKWEFGLK